MANSQVALLVANYFEQPELVEPRSALQEAGYDAVIVSISDSQLQSMDGDAHKADTYTADKKLADVTSDEFAGLVVPGGTINADMLRQDERAHAFVKSFLEAGKPVAIICHAPWLLVSADMVKGRKLTSYPSLAVDIRNAGGTWVDQAVVIDGNLITSRTPDDLESFNGALLDALKKMKEG